MTLARPALLSWKEMMSGCPSPPTAQRLRLWPGSDFSERFRLSHDVWCLAPAASFCTSSLGRDISLPEG